MQSSFPQAKFMSKLDLENSLLWHKIICFAIINKSCLDYLLILFRKTLEELDDHMLFHPAYSLGVL